MMGGFTIGPVSFSVGLLSTFVAIMLTLFVGNRLARKRGLDIETSLWLVVGVALLAARGVYVARYAKLYLAAPHSILDIRDGGFSLAAGLGAGILTALLLAWRRRDYRVPLLAGAGAGASVFAFVALLALVLPGPVVRLPHMTLARLDGGSLPLASQPERPVVLNLWASWCGPCRREMPVLRAAQLAHPDVTFIFVNQGETPDAIRKYMTGQGITLDNVVLDGAPGLANVLKSKALPATFFFDGKGVLVERRVGELSSATLGERLRTIGK